MNKSELVGAIAAKTGQSQSDVDATISAFFDVVSGVVAAGTEKVSIPGYLSFEQTTRSARQGRNPQTGETIHIPAKKTVKVSAGAKLKAAAASGF